MDLSPASRRNCAGQGQADFLCAASLEIAMGGDQVCRTLRRSIGISKRQFDKPDVPESATGLRTTARAKSGLPPLCTPVRREGLKHFTARRRGACWILSSFVWLSFCWLPAGRCLSPGGMLGRACLRFHSHVPLSTPAEKLFTAHPYDYGWTANVQPDPGCSVEKLKIRLCESELYWSRSWKR